MSLLEVDRTLLEEDAGWRSKRNDPHVVDGKSIGSRRRLEGVGVGLEGTLWIKTLLMEGWIRTLLTEGRLDPYVVDGRVGRDADWKGRCCCWSD